MVRELAPAKLNLVLHVGPPRRRAAPDLLAVRLARARRRARGAGGRRRARRTRVVCPGVEGENLAAAALARSARAATGGLPPLEVRIRQADPGGRGARRRQRRRRRGAAGRQPDRRRARSTPTALRALAAGLGSDVPSQVEPGHALVTGTGEMVEPIELPAVHAGAGASGPARAVRGDGVRGARPPRAAGARGSTRRRCASSPVPAAARWRARSRTTWSPPRSRSARASAPALGRPA